MAFLHDQGDGKAGQIALLIHWPGKMIALKQSASDNAQHIHLGFIFHAFDHHLHAQSLDQADHRGADGAGFCGTGDVAHQTTVDLDTVDRQFAQAGKVGIAGPEIVYGDVQAFGPHGGQLVEDAGLHIHRDRFGNFQCQH